MKKQRKENLLNLSEEGLELTDINFVTDFINDLEKENPNEGPSKSKVLLETEELIRSLTIDKKFSKAFELCLRLRPIGLKLKKIDMKNYHLEWVLLLFSMMMKLIYISIIVISVIKQEI